MCTFYRSFNIIKSMNHFVLLLFEHKCRARFMRENQGMCKELCVRQRKKKILPIGN